MALRHFSLYLAIVHELGHVFGIPHIGETYSLMSERFIEFILNRAVAEPLKVWKVAGYTPVPFFFFPANYFVNCTKTGFAPSATKFLGIPGWEYLLALCHR